MNRLFKVLQVGMTKNIGGVETYLMEQYRHLDRRRIDYDFINMIGENNIAFEDEIKSKGNKIYDIISRGKNPLKHYWQWIKFFYRYAKFYDAIVFNTCDLYHMCPLFLAKIFKIKIRIIHSHNSSNDKKENFLRKILIKINKILMNISVTDYWACSTEAGRWMFGRKREFKLIHNLIDSKKYIYNLEIRKNIRRNLKIEDKFVIGHIGRFSYQKNHEFLIKIFNEIYKKNKNSILLLIGGKTGNKSYYQESVNLVDKMGLKNNVYFLGMKKNVADYYQAMDCFILPSKFEGLPIVGIEAQTAGLKIFLSDIITKEVQITDLVEYISLEENPAIWAEKILKSENYNRINMYEKIVESGYDVEVGNKKFQKYFISLLNK